MPILTVIPCIPRALHKCAKDCFLPLAPPASRHFNRAKFGTERASSTAGEAKSAQLVRG
jgi:hypothetical protein